MNAITIDNWEITNAFGQYLKIEENELFDLCLRGEKRVESYLWHAVRPTRIIDYFKGYVLTDSKVVYLLGNPSRAYQRLFQMTTKRFDEIVTRKLRLR